MSADELVNESTWRRLTSHLTDAAASAPRNRTSRNSTHAGGSAAPAAAAAVPDAVARTNTYLRGDLMYDPTGRVKRLLGGVRACAAPPAR